MFAQKSMKDLLSGLIFIGIGLAFAYAALSYDLGTAFRMGPGYFPMILAGILVVLGVIILIQSLASGPDETQFDAVPWLALILIMGALVFFGMTVRGLGLGPSLFVTSFMSAFASKRTGLIGALLLASFLTLISLLIFVWALGLPLPILGPWLNF